jgi:acetyl/propionyl-CoA carboxylase alpha subunit/acetyl-CoA carboxylase carboxyltransferase component
MPSDFRRIAIVNRGEPAMRLIHAVRELRRETGDELTTIALYTDPDRHAMFVREADEAHSLGSATFVDERDGQRKNRYLDYEALERALVETRAEAAWVGWGFVAEHPHFVELCDRLGVTFIGPSAAVMRRLGDKITSKRLAEAARVPVAAWSDGPVETIDEALAHARRIGFPLLIKATSGGGGRGIRRVRSEEELAEAFERSRSEAMKGFGDPTVFLERMVANARHVEVQIIADQHGNVWPVGVRDCSVQRRNQKLLEESASTALNLYRDRKVREAASRLCKSAGYFGAGTVEFLYDPKNREIAFMEVNARLQVEHPVTEVTTGVDLVKLQIQVARGEQLEGKPPRTIGHAIEARLNAENPDAGFSPAPGKIELFRVPTGPGVRVDTGVAEGDQIAPEFDSMIAKIIAVGADREEAIARLVRALEECAIVVRGGTTNKAFLAELLTSEDFRGGSIDIGWLDRLTERGERPPRPHGEVALVQAAIEVYRDELNTERNAFLYSAYRGRPHVASLIGRKVELRLGGNPYKLLVYCLGDGAWRVELDGARVDVHEEVIGTFDRRLTIGRKTYHSISVSDGLDHRIDIDGAPHVVSRDDGGIIRSSAPAVVVSVRVSAGDTVRLGETVAVLEAMKMEMPVPAPFPGKVREIMTAANEQVEAGAPLLQIEPEELAASGPSTERLRLEVFADERRPVVDPLERCLVLLRELERLTLGFDVDPSAAKRLVSLREEICASIEPDEPEVFEQEKELLESFADVAYLSSREPEEDADDPILLGQSPQQELFTYMRALDGKAQGMPRSFVASIERALRHYRVEELERTKALEEALMWIFKAHSRVELQIAPVMAILDRHLRDSGSLLPLANKSFRLLLGRLIAVSRGRFPALEDLAREVRYEFFDKPLLERARTRIYDEVIEHLEYLAKHPDADDRSTRMAKLVDCPQPLLGLLSSRFVEADLSMRHLILESMLRRYYRTRKLDNVRVVTIEGSSMALAEYRHEGKRIHVVAMHAPQDKLTRVGQLMTPVVRELPDGDEIHVDFFVRTPSSPTHDADEQRRICESFLSTLDFPKRVDRVVVSLTGPTSGSSPLHLTFQPGEDGRFVEHSFFRGVHPLMAERLDLWRLSNFEVDRVPSAEDVYLFHAVAKDNPKDERLFALAEVRDLTPRRDARGRIVSLPHLERMLYEALAGIRRHQSTRPAHKRLYWNRVVLYAWPEFEMSSREMLSIARRLAPATAGLGVEKVVVRGNFRAPGSQRVEEGELHISNPAGRGVVLKRHPVSDRPIRPLTPYIQNVVKMQRRGLNYPYEIIRMLTSEEESGEAALPPGRFQEYDAGPSGKLEPVDREYGQNKAHIVVGVIENRTTKHPEGMKRVILLGDPSRALGSLAEPECRRIIGALDLAEELGLPVEWFAVSAGAKISMESGTENMDWIALVLRRIVLFTQAGHEINVIVHGVNVGAQPYWNAESTMLMHTRGILVMTPNGAMVLTGKRALDYSGSVSAEDNFGIGGFDRVMGPNGQAQYWARDLADACGILLRHYEHAYRTPGERFPRRGETTDPVERNVCEYPYGGAEGSAFSTVGEVFSPEHNPGRKRPFEIRRIMKAVVDQDFQPLERWRTMRDAETGVVWDAHFGGYPVCLLGLESRPVQRTGLVPADGPEQWTSGTLFPQSSKKIARALNAASGNRPVVVLANLSGFDGSPESMRNLQLEFGAEIGRAVVNFRGPIVFTVISRYHGGAFVVFSRALNESMEVSALEHTFASVIGGAPAAAVVFARDVEQRTKADPRVREMEEKIAATKGSARSKLRAEYAELVKLVRSETLGAVASEFDSIHNVERARRVGSVNEIIPPETLRPYIISSLERGIAREMARDPNAPLAFPDWTRPDLFAPPSDEGEGVSGSASEEEVPAREASETAESRGEKSSS